VEDGIGRREVGLQRTRGKPAVSFYIQLPLQRLEAALGDASGITASRLVGFLGSLASPQAGQGGSGAPLGRAVLGGAPETPRPGSSGVQGGTTWRAGHIFEKRSGAKIDVVSTNQRFRLICRPTRTILPSRG